MVTLHHLFGGHSRPVLMVIGCFVQADKRKVSGECARGNGNKVAKNLMGIIIEWLCTAAAHSPARPGGHPSVHLPGRWFSRSWVAGKWNGKNWISFPNFTFLQMNRNDYENVDLLAAKCREIHYILSLALCCPIQCYPLQSTNGVDERRKRCKNCSNCLRSFSRLNILSIFVIKDCEWAVTRGTSEGGKGYISDEVEGCSAPPPPFTRLLVVGGRRRRWRGRWWVFHGIDILRDII